MQYPSFMIVQISIWPAVKIETWQSIEIQIQPDIEISIWSDVWDFPHMDVISLGLNGRDRWSIYQWQPSLERLPPPCLEDLALNFTSRVLPSLVCFDNFSRFFGFGLLFVSESFMTFPDTSAAYLETYIWKISHQLQGHWQHYQIWMNIEQAILMLIIVWDIERKNIDEEPQSLREKKRRFSQSLDSVCLSIIWYIHSYLYTSQKLPCMLKLAQVYFNLIFSTEINLLSVFSSRVK